MFPVGVKNQKNLFDLLKETDMPHGKILIHMEKTAVIMWKLTNWPTVKQQGIMFGGEIPGLKGKLSIKILKGI